MTIPDSTRLKLFVGVVPGLERVLEEELKALDLAHGLRQLEGGVEVRLAPAQMWRLVHEARVPELLRVRLGRFPARHFDQLAKGLQKLPWAAYFARGTAPSVKVSSRSSRLYHSGAVQERAEATIAERLAGEGRFAEPPTSVVHIRIFDDQAEVSVDAVGERLHRRGYRVHVGQAPLRETLASACLRGAGWRDDAQLWDPMCGSGTFVIEAASRAHAHPVPVRRSFAFTEWPTHDAEAFTRVVAGYEHQRSMVEQRLVAFGSDKELTEVAAARTNADAARLSDACQFMVGDFDDVEPDVPEGCTVLTNLPYGRRVGDATLGEVYARFVAMLERRPDLRPAFVLSGNPHFKRLAGGRWRRLLSFKNGGVPVELLAYEGPGRSGGGRSTGHAQRPQSTQGGKSRGKGRRRR